MGCALMVDVTERQPIVFKKKSGHQCARNVESPMQNPIHNKSGAVHLFRHIFLGGK